MEAAGDAQEDLHRFGGLRDPGVHKPWTCRRSSSRSLHRPSRHVAEWDELGWIGAAAATPMEPAFASCRYAMWPARSCPALAVKLSEPLRASPHTAKAVGPAPPDFYPKCVVVLWDTLPAATGTAPAVLVTCGNVAATMGAGTAD